MTDEDGLMLPGCAHPRFRTRTVRIEPGGTRPFVESDWRDSLVIIRSGEVELVAASGARHRCTAGDILWLAGLPLHGLFNPGSTPTVIGTVRRR